MTHITIEKEKLEQVLESLEDLQRQYSIYPNSFWDWSKGRKAITTLMQALAAPVQKRPPNCGTGYCSCIECVMEPAPTVPLADDTRRLDALAKNSWDLRCFDMSSEDIGWRVIEHHMAKPHERIVAEVFRDDPRQAIDAAMRAAHGITKGQP
jgi:hypothetical protein